MECRRGMGTVPHTETEQRQTAQGDESSGLPSTPNSGSSREFLRLFLPSLFILTVILGAFHFSSQTFSQRTLSTQEQARLLIVDRTVRRGFDLIMSDLLVLANSEEMLHLLGAKNSLKAWTHAAKEFVTYSRFKGIYDQIRFIDKDGMEALRVNFNGGDPAIVPQSTMQDKSGRYYFSETIKLNKGEIFISPLDLNVEHKKVEIPFKPMIRFGTPVFDGKGRKQGVIVLNYLAGELLERLTRTFGESQGTGLLLNSDEHLLLGPDPDTLWGFMFGRDATFATHHPETWKRIQSTDSGETVMNGGLLVFRSLLPLTEMAESKAQRQGKRISTLAGEGPGAYVWKAVIHVPAQVLSNTLAHQKRILFFVWIALTWIMGGASWYFAQLRLDQKRTEGAMAQMSRRNALILEGAGDGIYGVDPERRTTFFNAAATRMTGWGPDELDGQSPHDAFHHTKPDGTPYPASDCPIHKTLETGNVHQVSDEVFWRKDGTSFPVEYICTPLKEGGVVTGAVVIFRDITERLAIETAMQESLNRFFLVMESLDAMVYVADMETHQILFANQTVREVYGNVEGETCWQVLHSDQDGPCSFCNFDQLVDEDGHPSGTHVWEYHSDQRGRWYEHRDRAVPWSDGRLVRLEIATDITDRKRLEQDLKGKTRELERSNTELQQFASVASHDLQEPLRVVNSFLGLLRHKYGDQLDEKANQYIEFAVDGADRMGQMIRGLLDYSRVQTRGQEFEIVDSGTILEDALANLAQAIRDIGAKVEISGNLPNVSGDDSQLTRVFQNLIGNAIKYVDPGCAPEIEVTVEQNDDDWVFSIRDNGIGIDEKDFETVFRLFERLQGRGEYEGSGIGLAVVKRIIERHDGRIWVDSEPGHGSTFSFTLPVIGL